MRIVGGQFSGRALLSPKNIAIRPTRDRVRENLFNILTHFQEDFFVKKRILDLFAGTGALGLEALSRGAAHCIFIETCPSARAIIQQNIENFNLQGRTRLLRRDATDLGNSTFSQKCDIIFADPPYGKNLGMKALQAACKGGWVHSEAIFILEEAKGAPIEMAEGFSLLQEKSYGQTILYIYKK